MIVHDRPIPESLETAAAREGDVLYLMATVFLPVPLRDLTRGQAEIQVAARTLREVIAELETRFPGIAERLCEGDQLAPTLQVAIGQVMTKSMAAAVEADSEVHFLPAIGGG